MGQEQIIGKFELYLRSCVGRDWDYKIHGYHFRGPIRRVAIVDDEADGRSKLEIFLDWEASLERSKWFLDNKPETNPYHGAENGCFSIGFDLGNLTIAEDGEGNLHLSAPNIQSGTIHKPGENLKKDTLLTPGEAFDLD